MSSPAEANPGTASSSFLRLIAHELRQPLSTIESIAYYLTLILPPGDRRSQEHLAHIQQLVGQSNWIISSGLHLSELPHASAEPLNLNELITHTVSNTLGV